MAEQTTETTQHTRSDAVLVMAYVEGWLDNDFPEASHYLREHMEEIADQMVEDHCAAPDVVLPPGQPSDQPEVTP